MFRVPRQPSKVNMGNLVFISSVELTEYFNIAIIVMYVIARIKIKRKNT